MAILVQDVWLGWELRPPPRRLAPWKGAKVRLVHCPPPGERANAGRPGRGTLGGARRRVTEALDRWGHDVEVAASRVAPVGVAP